MKSIALFSILMIFTSGNFIRSEEVTVIDTRDATSDLGWKTTAGGWNEVTSTDETDVDLRTFEVCRIHWPDQDNWLRTPYLNVSDARTIFIEVRFTIRSCEGMSNIVSCKETFNLFYLPSSNSNDVRANRFDEKTYLKVDTIAAGSRFDSGTSSFNVETRTIKIPTRGFFVAFQDTGACMSIIHVRVYYKVCSSTKQNLSMFATTHVGPYPTSMKEVKGECVKNAILSTTKPVPSLYCGADGRWLFNSGECVCDQGYFPNLERTSCVGCPPGKFKKSTGNGYCSSCPRNSYSFEEGTTSCPCTSGYFRAANERSDFPCSRPPSKPTFARTKVNDSSIVIRWSRPSDNGGRSDVTYSVFCERCDSYNTLCMPCNDDVTFVPKRSQLTYGNVVIQDFVPNTNYKFKIFSTNGVSVISGGAPDFVEVSVKTKKAVPSAIQFVRVISTDDRSAMLQWTEPTYSGLHIIEYQIRYSKAQTVFTVKTKETLFKLQQLEPYTSYMVQIRAQNEAGFGPFSRSIAFRTKTSSSASTDDSGAPSSGSNNDQNIQDGTNDGTKWSKRNDHFVLAIVIAASGVILILAILMLCYWRKRRRSNSPNSKKYPVYDSTTELLHARSYVDPSTYEDPYLAVVKFAKEIDRKSIKLERTLGSGEFGEVSKGSLESKSTVRPIAIKTLKMGSSTEQKWNFLSEAFIMGQFDHPNVIRLEGIVTKSTPLMIITEYMVNGSLDNYLKSNKNSLHVTQLVSMLYQIALGMKYLTQMGYVHRDLAARNVLVNSKIQCKVSDFGLSRSITKLPQDEETTTMLSSKSGMIPVRWSPPEVLNSQIFSSASDVWSFGILSWEVLTRGERPYWEMTNKDVAYFVECGYRLPAPWYCPKVLHQLMLECWNKDYTNRIFFNHLVVLLANFQQQPSSLNEVLNQRSFREQEDCIPEMMDLSSLSHWLEEIHLLGYKHVMLRHGCVTAEQLMRLTEDELHYMEITQPNDVNTFLHEAEILRYRIEEANKKGVAV